MMYCTLYFLYFDYIVVYYITFFLLRSNMNLSHYLLCMSNMLYLRCIEKCRNKVKSNYCHLTLIAVFLISFDPAGCSAPPNTNGTGSYFGTVTFACKPKYELEVGGTVEESTCTNGEWIPSINCITGKRAVML